MPAPDGEGSGGPVDGGGIRRFPLRNLGNAPRRVRGGGYTCPRPDYDGGGGGEYDAFLGFMAPLGQEPADVLVNPVDPYGGGFGPGLGEMGPGEFVPFDDTPGYYRRVDSQLAQQREMEEIQRIMGRIGGHSADGLFGFSGSPECDEPAPPVSRQPGDCCTQLLKAIKRLEKLARSKLAAGIK
jgi:hypothetical protein